MTGTAPGFVLDASAAIALFADEMRAASLPPGEAHAPEVIDLEFLSAVRKLLHRQLLTLPRATQLVGDWATNPVFRSSHTKLLPRIWDYRDNITAYDASYVALAEHLRLPLVTADLRLARAAARYCEVITIDQA